LTNGCNTLADVLEVVGYEQAKILHTEVPATVLDVLEELLCTASHQSDVGVPPLAELYPTVVRLAALSLMAMRALPLPDEIDGLRGFEGLAS
jgi:hypothetical protein